MACNCGSSNKSKNKGDYICHDVPLVLQDHNWDCGIACTKMVLNVWTIDIASIFNMYEIKHLLITQTLGVDHTYEAEAFYQRSFTSEEKRINTLFEEAANQGICIEKRSVKITEILEHLRNGDVAIVLVDSAILRHYEFELSTNSSDLSPNRMSPGYHGHFIVLCGFDEVQQLVIYRNPSFTGLFNSKFDNFDEARKAYGTDEDILLIYNDKVEVKKCR